MNVLSEIALDPAGEMQSGTQALIQGLLFQAKLDRGAGRRTAGFISGYRGSPFGNVDLELWRIQESLNTHGIVFQPGLNEDLAATACWGTQQVPLMANPKQDGVFAFWYGKGPGVDRSGDAFKHGNLAGTSPLGGVVLLAGDDHGAKSSSTAHQSEHAFMAASIPVFNPSSIDEYFEFLPAAVALSRFAGVWAGFKCATEIVEASTPIRLDRKLPKFAFPEIDIPEGGFHISTRFAPLALEESLHRFRLPAVRRFTAANGFDRVTHEAATRSLGIVAPGKAHVDVCEALRLLGLDTATASRLGIRIFKPLITWPLEPDAAKNFCAGHREVLVVEEKRAFVEGQIAQLLLALPNDDRPRLSGKATPEGAPLCPEYGELTAASVALVLGARLTALGLADASIQAALARLTAQDAVKRIAAPGARAPMFCSGCPHNRSTHLPEGSEAFGGIGCHGMAMWIPELRTSPSTHMGGEGGTWLGIAPFGGPEHMFQNMGDGTYAHSGSLAIRAAIAGKANITYKILCNSAVAMTGGQPVEGSPDAAAIATQTAAEGAAKVVIVSEDPERFKNLNPAIEIFHRDELMRVQRDLRALPGVTILVYDQGCAAERRRLRKKGEYPDLPLRSFINSDVCEGCGDCNAKSSCVSVLPVETELGVKREIDQESCNKDYTCTQGFCPSFVTVIGGAPRRAGIDKKLLEKLREQLTEPAVAPFRHQTFNIVLAGIGGTGVVTLGGLLARAAVIAGYGVLTFDVTGVSQKNGAVFSHVRLFENQRAEQFRPRVPRGQLDLLLGCDIIAAAAPEVVQLLADGRTQAVINSDIVPTAEFQRNLGYERNPLRFQAVFAEIFNADRDIHYVEPGPAIIASVGAGPLLNIFLLGVACQRGLLPLTLKSLETALGDGRSAKGNLLAFQLGRYAAQDRAALDRLLGAEPPPVPLAALGFEAIIARARSLLTSYQNKAYANRYEEFVRSISAQDSRGDFSHAVALNLFKLMRYKDEYEVARLHAAPEFRKRLALAFDGPYRLNFNLAPPLLSFRKTDTGEPRKYRFGSWMNAFFQILQHFKFLRGTPFDPFGRFTDRRTERRLIEDYKQWVGELTPLLNDDNYAVAVSIASLPDSIRGFGPVKERNVALARSRKNELSVQLAKAGSAPRQVNHV